jgi:predicted nucleic acid-binding protein
MIFADLGAGDSVFVDANTFVYHFTADPRFGSACSQLLQRIARRKLAAFTATHILSEVAHRVMTIEASSLQKWPASGIVPRLKQNPGIVQNLTNFRQAVEQIPLYGIHVLVIPAGLVAAAAIISQQIGLLSNDALIVAVMRTHGLTNLASNDTDFDRVPGLTRYAPA